MQTSLGRSIIVAVRVTGAEQKALVAQADAERVSISDLLRRRVGLPEHPPMSDAQEAAWQGRRGRRA